MRPTTFVFLCTAIPLGAAAQVNAYANVTGVVGQVISVASVNETFDTFEDGEVAIIMQMQADVCGANVANNPSFGNMASTGVAGKWEVITIATHTEIASLPNTITTGSPLTNIYQFNARSRVQLISFPQFGAPNWTSIAPITAIPWNGTTGGVVAFGVPEKLTLMFDVDANGAGFRGGSASADLTAACNTVTFATASSGYGAKGEGIQRVDVPAVQYGKGKFVTGGGGGSPNNAGGGGGGYVTVGGAGGNGYTCAAGAGGLGGVSIFPILYYDRFFMGGGGGGGQQNNSAGGNGGNAGGIVIIKADTLCTVGTCPLIRIRANGNIGGSSIGNPSDGAGGGGSGGTVYLDVNVVKTPLTCPLVCTANGGNGGNVTNTALSPGDWVDTGGGGGGGGQGLVFCAAAIVPGSGVTASTAAGVGGIHQPSGTRAGSGPGLPNAGVQGFGGTIILPVELLYFAATDATRGVELDWATASEHDNAWFNVQRSVDGVEWTRIDRIPGARNSQSELNYSSFDPDPARGINYYRLMQEDFDGAVHFSNVAAVDHTSTNGLSLYPNPVQHELHVLLSDDDVNELTITDAAGRTVMQRSVAGGSAIIDMSTVPPGSYVISATAPMGGIRRSTVLVTP